MDSTIEIRITDTALIVRNPIPLDALRGIEAMARAYGFDRIAAWACRPLGAMMVITNEELAPLLRAEIQEAALKTAGGDVLEGWLAGPDTGLSSLTIAEVLAPRFGLTEHHDPPRDPSSFGLCVGLLEKMPAWRGRLLEVADEYPGWRAVVDAWDELEELWYHSPTDPLSASKLRGRLRELSP